MKTKHSAPVFIHSLFRSGSTYLFDVFRRSPSAYCCYQEPFNEQLIALNFDPDRLAEIPKDTLLSLRHPKTDKPYFWEFYQAKNRLSGLFDKSFSYDEFFVENAEMFTGKQSMYLDALILGSTSRPVLEFCRSSGRIFVLKELYKGIHIHLWRKPRDQWWSFKINDYFDSATQLIYNAKKLPPVLQFVKHQCAIYDFHDKNVEKEFEYARKRPLSMKCNYFSFYSFWLYSFIECNKYSDVVISVERLAIDEGYRIAITNQLAKFEVEDVDFYDCKIPQSYYLDKEKIFYEEIEKRVMKIFLSYGYEKEILGKAVDACNETYAKGVLSSNTMDLAGSLMRARDTSFSLFERMVNAQSRLLLEEGVSGELENTANSNANLINKLRVELKENSNNLLLNEALLKNLQGLNDVLDSDLNAVHMRLESLVGERVLKDGVIDHLNGQVKEITKENFDIKLKLDKVSVHASSLESELSSFYGSKSWRITLPLRQLILNSELIIKKGGGLKKIPEDLVRKGLGLLAKKIIITPKLKSKALGFLASRPQLKEKIRSLFVDRQLYNVRKIKGSSEKKGGDVKGGSYLSPLNKLFAIVSSNFISPENMEVLVYGWSSEAVKIMSRVMVLTDGIEVKNINESSLEKEELIHILYFVYLRRYADKEAIKALSEFENLEIKTHLINKLPNSVEYEANGRIFQNRFDILQGNKVNSIGSDNRVFFNVTNLFFSKNTTGIQRVVTEITSLIKARAATIKLVYFDVSNFFECEFDKQMILKVSHPEKVCLYKGDVFVDIDASWGNRVSQYQFYRQIKSAGVRIVVLNHDIAPFLYPQYSDPTTVLRFIEHFNAVATFSDLFICSTESAKKELADLISSVGYKKTSIERIDFGNDFQKTFSPTVELSLKGNSSKCPSYKGKKYILLVGTIEPRKNYGYLLGLVEKINKLGIDIIIVGKIGWEEKKVIDELKEHMAKGKIKLLTGVDDDVLNDLYVNCFSFVQLSHHEGYGLPVVEAISKGCVAIIPSTGAVREVSQDKALYIDIKKPKDLYNKLEMLSLSSDKYKDCKELAAQYVPNSWNSTAIQCLDVINKFIVGFDENINSIQLVYISIRPSDIKRSIDSLVNCMSIRSVLVLTSSSKSEAMSAVLSACGISYKVLFDNEFFSEEKLSELDHSSKNFILRRELYKSSYVDSLFLALDDDCLALAGASLDFFINNKKMNSFYFFDSMKNWKASPFGVQDFDYAQWNTSDVLVEYGYADKGFAVHHAQLVDKRIINEVFEEFGGLECIQLDEWSLYFNVACQRYCNQLNVIPSTTLYWPENIEMWKPSHFSDDLVFCNYYQDAQLHDLTGAVDDYKVSYKKAEYVEKLNGEWFKDKNWIQITECQISITLEILYGLPNTWVLVPIETLGKYYKLGYKIEDSKGIMVVNGERDVQSVSTRTGIKIKMPMMVGNYKLWLMLLGAEDCDSATFELKVVTYGLVSNNNLIV